ncbi:MAG: helix-turn-helix domain-containing protein [Fimbriimonadaceae bacterium]
MLLAADGAELGETELAAAVGYSVSQCRRFAEQVMGEPLGGFGQRLRLERAAGHLSVEKVPVAEVGAGAGYSTPATFARAFVEWFGSTPSEFRALNSSAACLFPGYLISEYREAQIPNSVAVRLGDGSSVCFMYDGPVLLGRRLPNGAIVLG